MAVLSFVQIHWPSLRYAAEGEIFSRKKAREYAKDKKKISGDFLRPLFAFLRPDSSSSLPSA
jgi:hypothetical protein